ncbi:MAG: hypothetical protein RDV48_09520 [Candidatus Eremiobacteraeota bacterium]|nr:hypothetical protein [Candidatus Eremiobacteraeota bacterium]
METDLSLHEAAEYLRGREERCRFPGRYQEDTLEDFTGIYLKGGSSMERPAGFLMAGPLPK